VNQATASPQKPILATVPPVENNAIINPAIELIKTAET